MKTYKYQIFIKQFDVWVPLNGQFTDYSRSVDSAMQVARIRGLNTEEIRIWRLESEWFEELWRL